MVTRISGELEGIGLIWCPERLENVVGRYRQPCLAFPQPYGANAKFQLGWDAYAVGGLEIPTSSQFTLLQLLFLGCTDASFLA